MGFAGKIFILVVVWHSILIIAALLFGEVGALAIMGAAIWTAFSYALHIAFGD